MTTTPTPNLTPEIKFYRFLMRCGCSGSIQPRWVNPAMENCEWRAYLDASFCGGHPVWKLGGSFQAKGSQTFEEHLRHSFEGNLRLAGTADGLLDSFVCPKLRVNEIHPRMWRPGLSTPFVTSDGYTDATTAFVSLQPDLLDLFRVIEPSQANAKAYGHATRELLILACTEVDLLLKSVLKANGHPTPNNDFWTTKHYVKVLPALRLDQWEVNLRRYEGYPDVRPFAGWCAANATGSLWWYDAYNKAKHDRISGFPGANFDAVVNAMAAIFVLLGAQFGIGMPFRGRFGQSEEERVFYFHDTPEFPLEDHYILVSNKDAQGPSYVNYPF